MLKSEWRRAVPGAVLAAVAVLTLYVARGLSHGTPEHAGPGTVPGVLAALLFILGLAVAAEAFLRRPIGGED